MSEHMVYNKRKIGFTEVSDFTDFQGIGADPLYKRYDSVQAVLRTCIDEKYKSFLAEPIYDSDQDTIDWYVEKWEEHPMRLSDLKGSERERYQKIFDGTLQHYRNAAMQLEGDDLMILGGALKFISDEMAFCYDNKVVVICWGMRYDTQKHLDIGGLLYEFEPAHPVMCQVIFDPGKNGILEGNGVVNLQAGSTITADKVPAIKAHPNYTFSAWDRNPVGQEVDADMVFTATYVQKPPAVAPEKETPPPPSYNISFHPGGNGTLNGISQFRLPAGTTITAGMIPSVVAQRGYKFEGWDVNPLNHVVSADRIFSARYRKKSKWWLWLLLALLILLLLLLLFFWLKKWSDNRPAPPPVNNSEEEVITDTIVPSKGDVEITLRWGDYNDLDLYCEDPTGEEIYYNNLTSSSGGILEYDMNVSPDKMSNTPIEHIYWPNGRAPHGAYTVQVHRAAGFYEDLPQKSTFSLRIKYGDKEETHTGTVSIDNTTKTYHFSF